MIRGSSKRVLCRLRGDNINKPTNWCVKIPDTRLGHRSLSFWNKTQSVQTISSASVRSFNKRRCSSSSANDIFPKHDDFALRHNGPNDAEMKKMLEVLGVEVSSRQVWYQYYTCSVFYRLLL